MVGGSFAYATHMRMLPYLVLVCVPLKALAAQDEPSPPNIIYILADDLGIGELGCYGQDKILTPAIDRLASRGMRFERHYAGSSVCAPSRCVLLTGLHTGHSRIRNNSSWHRKNNPHGEGQYPLEPGTTTLGTLLQRAGYATGAFGKWGLGGPAESGEPHLQGFDQFFGFLCQAKAHNFYPQNLWHNGEQVSTGNRPFSAHQRLKEAPDSPEAYDLYKGESYAPELFLEQALDFIREHQEDPFCLFFPSTIPHVALQVPDKYLELYPEDWDEQPYLGTRGYLPHPRPRAAYAAMVSYLDQQVGRIVGTIEELGLAEQTLIIFSSDNGPSYNGGSDSRFFDSAGGLRGLKGSLFEGGLRVPMIASWPGTIEMGSVSQAITGFQDLMPTLCELLGLKVPEGLDGISFDGPLLGQEDELTPEGRPPLYFELGGKRAVLDGDWKFVEEVNKRGEPTRYLFDLSRDGQEQHNLAAKQPKRLAELLELARSSRTRSEAFAGPFDEEVAPGKKR